MHYERFRDHDYLGAWDFEEGDRTLTIDRVEQGTIDRGSGEKPERVPLMFFREVDRPMVLNSTNGMMIRMIYGTPDTRDWQGKPISVGTGLTTDKQGHPILGIRVKPMRPPMPTAATSEADRIAELEAQLAAARAAAPSPAPPAELPAPVPTTVNAVPEEVLHGKVA